MSDFKLRQQSETLKKLTEWADERGWDGVSNPKNLFDFIVQLFEEKEKEIKQLEAFKQAIDDELVLLHLGTADQFTPKDAIHKIIYWNIKTHTDPKINGGEELVAFKEFHEELNSIINNLVSKYEQKSRRNSTIS